jgi:L-ribulose-5-phosphate 4-epimerase
MIDEGYIKYQCHWNKINAIAEEDIEELNQWRTRLYQLGLIGEYDNGIGFGNLSVRLSPSQDLIISGTQTGGIAELTTQHYTKVTDFDWHKNYVICEGLIKASSETLTHAAIYVAQPTVNAVVHVHNAKLWRELLNQVPTTNPNCAYGTPEMAEEIIKLCQQPETQQQKIIVMSGHEEGILTFGKNLNEAGNILLNRFLA